MSKNFVLWNQEPSKGDADNLIWCARVDGRYQIEVQRTSKSQGLLCIFDSEKQMQLIWSETTYLSYGAIHGPDVEDVLRWQKIVEDQIDDFSHEDQSDHRQ